MLLQKKGRLMRALTWLVVIVSGLWFGYWWVGSSAVQKGAEFLLANPPEGVQLSHESVVVQGFPNRFDLTVNAPSFFDTVKKIGWEAPFVQIFSMTWKPWHFIAALPHTQKIMLPGEMITLKSDHLVGSLLLHPGVDLALNEITAEGETLSLQSDNEWGATIAKAVLASREDSSLKNSYRIGAEISSISLGADLMTKLSDTGLPAEISELHLDCYATLTAPIDRHADQNHLKLQSLDLRDAHLIWGDFSIVANGSVTADADGLAEGQIKIEVKNWNALPSLLAALGAIPPGFVQGLTSGFSAMTKDQTDPTLLNLTLKAAGGRLSLGPFPLGAAPKFN